MTKGRGERENEAEEWRPGEMRGCHGNDWHVGRDEAHEQTSGKTGEKTFSRLSELGKGDFYEP